MTDDTLDELIEELEWVTLSHGNVEKDPIVTCKICKAARDALKDDGFHNFKDWTNLGLLYDAPHNKDAKLTSNLTRVFGWTSVMKLLVH